MAAKVNESREADASVTYSRSRIVAAWCVHALTASGIVWCLLALDAATTARWREALLGLMVAMGVDAGEGTLARLVRVKEVLPGFDGTLLDNLVDYLSYVLVPAFILHHAELLPTQLSMPLSLAICLASVYQFCQEDAKTADHTFTGFPSYWNIAVLYLLALGWSATINAVIIGLLVVLVFVPIKYVYPTRTPHWQKLTLTLTALWAAMALAIIVQLPNPNGWLVWLSLAYVVYYAALSLHLTFRKPRNSSC